MDATTTATVTAVALSPAAIAATAGVVLSLLFNYVPGLNTRFDRLSADMQRVIMGAMLVLTGIGMALWQCSGESASTTAATLCGDGMNWRAIITNIVFALIGSQSADRISPKPRADEPAPTTARALVDPPRR